MKLDYRRLKELRENKGITQNELGKILNISPSSIGMYEQGRREPKFETICKIADLLDVTVDSLLGREPLKRGLLRDFNKKDVQKRNLLSQTSDEIEATVKNIVRKILSEEEKKKRGILIPILGTITAGVSIEDIEEILDWEEIPESMASQGDYFALRVKGQSMEPKFIEGDTVIVKKESCVKSGSVAVVLVNGEEATLKQVNVSPEGIVLIGYNIVVYEPHFYSNKEIQDLPVQILGEVVELRRKI